ncbi:hypothetical protein CW702_01950, partial [Candidatus Bathyarchaeota archaeon]
MLVKFAVSGDPHVGGEAKVPCKPTREELAQTSHWLKNDLEDISTFDPGLEFIVLCGDLTENGTRDDLRSYVNVVKSFRIPVYSVFGGHDALELRRKKELDQTRYYREIVGSLWYSFKKENFTFLVLVSEEPYLTPDQRRLQEKWLRE